MLVVVSRFASVVKHGMIFLWCVYDYYEWRWRQLHCGAREMFLCALCVAAGNLLARLFVWHVTETLLSELCTGMLRITTLQATTDSI
jgi:hypothetical protein